MAFVKPQIIIFLVAAALEFGSREIAEVGAQPGVCGFLPNTGCGCC